ncbi:ATP-binding protein [Methanosarcina sp. MSH10X1]|uniref:AlbA family DNA-binding domain-containing protein n=1 Tax=Methanosarcina sp. MSH10X1 TaxID=2507075 RepID=UPI000FFCA8CF|nr:ATP-binding protein [Methanosarcina sp. MSH10X1]RXA21885.1 ATP-binding protein [Methanosarcina sp. MSH10X1]
MVEKEVNTVCSQYGLRLTSLSELTLKVNLPDANLERGFIEQENSLYLPLHENKQAASSLSEVGMEFQAYIQFILNPKRVDSKYLADFFNNALGLKIRKAWETKGFIRGPEPRPDLYELAPDSSRVSALEAPARRAALSGESRVSSAARTINESRFAGRDSVEDMCIELDGSIDFFPGSEAPILAGNSQPLPTDIDFLMRSNLYLPDLQAQIKILKIKGLTGELISQLTLFEHRLSTYPKGLAHIEEKLELIREAIKLANDSDYILELIRRGEGKKLEFKSTLRMNLMSGKPDWSVEHAVLKTIIAYLNTDGGTLLVGVSNTGQVLGIENDNFPNEDKFLLHFKQLLKQHIGLAYASLIEYALVPVNGKKILKIGCQRSDEAVFLKPGKKEEEFYIRIGPSSERLAGSDLLEYVNRQYGRKPN